ncbi:MAG: response regulator [Proteobacteria bacterium]|nr:MAG: response regulator [Pseudomonadota bacterium]
MGRRRIMGSSCAILILLMIVVFAYLPIRIMHNTSSVGNSVARSHEVRKEIRDVSDAVRSVVYEHRNYIYTGEPEIQQRRNQEIARLLSEIEDLEILLTDNPIQLQKLEELRKIVGTHFLSSFMQEEPAKASVKSRTVGLKIVDQDRIIAPLFAVIQELDRNEIALLKVRQSKLEMTVRNDSWISIAMGVACLMLLCGLYTVYRLDAREKNRHAEVLRLANIEVEKANRMKSEFLAKMSHEIRTPLAAIIGFADLLSIPDLKEEERLRNVDVIRRNGRALGQIIDDILDLSKVEAGKISIEHIEFDLSELLGDIFLLFSRKAQDKGIQFSIESTTSVPSRLVSDPTRIRQILINMVSNSLKFTHQGSLRVIFQWEPEATNQFPRNGLLTFSIMDTGVGISDVHHERLFQPFSQAEDSTARQFGGTGLGLVLSRQLAKLLGGNVELKWSELGKGSCFQVTIKAVDSAESTQSVPHFLLNQSRSSPLEDEIVLTLDGIRILLAEDAPDNQLLITHILESSGAEVEVVGNGRDAVDHALAGGYHLVLMDVQMPILSGHEASQELRARGYCGPIVALTAHAMVEERQRSHDLGYDDYLTKPIDSLKLIQSIRMHAKKQGVIRNKNHAATKASLIDSLN